jgi:hypothetical protein
MRSLLFFSDVCALVRQRPSAANCVSLFRYLSAFHTFLIMLSKGELGDASNIVFVVAI